MNAEIDQKRRVALLILTGQHRAHRWQELFPKLGTERIAPNQAIRFHGDVHRRRPCLIGKFLQRAIDMDRRHIAGIGARLYF